MDKSNLRISVLLLLFSAFCLLWVIPAHTSAPQSSLDLSPAFLPKFAMGTILVLAVLLLCQSLNKIKTGGEIIDDEEFGDEATGFGGYEAANLFIWIALCIPLVFFMEILGFQFVSAATLIGLMWYAGERRLPFLFGIGIGAPVGIWNVAWRLLSRELRVWYVTWL